MAVHVRNKTSASRRAVASNGITAVTVFTFGTSLVDPDGSASGLGGILKRTRLYNPDTVGHRVKLHLVPSGGALGVDTVIYDNIVGVNCVDYCEFIEEAADGDFLQVVLGEAATTTQVQIKPVVSEMKAT